MFVGDEMMDSSSNNGGRYDELLPRRRYRALLNGPTPSGRKSRIVWTMEEKVYVMKLCSSQISILKNKKCDGKTIDEKNRVWAAITRLFNANHHDRKTAFEIKGVFERTSNSVRAKLRANAEELVKANKFGTQAVQSEANTLDECEVILATALVANDPMLMTGIAGSCLNLNNKAEHANNLLDSSMMSAEINEVSASSSMIMQETSAAVDNKLEVQSALKRVVIIAEGDQQQPQDTPLNLVPLKRRHLDAYFLRQQSGESNGQLEIMHDDDDSNKTSMNEKATTSAEQVSADSCFAATPDEGELLSTTSSKNGTGDGDDGADGSTSSQSDSSGVAVNDNKDDDADDDNKKINDRHHQRVVSVDDLRTLLAEESKLRLQVMSELHSQLIRYRQVLEPLIVAVLQKQLNNKNVEKE